MPTKKQSKKTNLNFKIFFASLFLFFIFSLSISSTAIACNCACAADTVIGFVCLDYCGESGSYCHGTKASLTSGPGVGNPTDYISLNYRYNRAPDGYEKNGYAFGNPIERFYGYRPYYRVFIPPGTTHIDMLTISNFYVPVDGTGDQRTHEGSVTNFNSPPKGDPAPVSWPAGASNADCFQDNSKSYYQLRNKECHTMAWQGFLRTIAMTYFDPNDQGGWLYVKISNIAGRGLAVPWVNGLGDNVPSYSTQVSVVVDTKIYNEWWDHYGSNADGSINWDKDVESLTAYVAPNLTSPTPTPTTTPTPTPQTPFPSGPDCNTKICQGNSCWNGERYIAGEKTQNCATVKIKTSKTSLTAPDSSYITWNSTNASKLGATCTGLYSANGRWYLSDAECKEKGEVAGCTDKGYEMKFPGDKFGTETCTFYLTNKSDGLPGTPSSFEIEAKKNLTSTSPTPTPTLSATIAQSVNSTTSTGTIGETFKITWSSEGATKCEITKSINQKASYKWGWLPGSYSGNNLNGSANASPSVIGTHVFKITCTDKDQKTVEKSITHEVNSQQTQQAQGLSCPEGDDPNCDKHTCKDVWCATGCGNNMKKGTKDCSGV